jgi:hypothetical protein
MVRRLALAFALTTLVACGDKDDSGESATGATCESMCADEGFDAGSLTEYDHEANCTCSGGSGVVSDAACTDLCTGLGWSAGETYSTTGGDMDSCSCY